MSAPKRIWAHWVKFPEGLPGVDGRCLMASDRPIEGYAPFVRADLVERLAEKAKALISATIKNGDTDDFEVYAARQDLKQALAAMGED